MFSYINCTDSIACCTDPDSHSSSVYTHLKAFRLRQVIAGLLPRRSARMPVDAHRSRLRFVPFRVDGSCWRTLRFRCSRNALRPHAVPEGFIIDVSVLPRNSLCSKGFACLCLYCATIVLGRQFSPQPVCYGGGVCRFKAAVDWNIPFLIVAPEPGLTAPYIAPFLRFTRSWCRLLSALPS